MPQWSRHLVATVALALAAAAVASAQVSFPQQIDAPAGKIVVYQPQPEKLTGIVLTGRAAMSLLPKGTKDPIFGAFWFSAKIDRDDEAGTTTLRDLRVTKARWPDSKPEQEKKFTEIVEGAAAKASLTISTESLSASLAAAEREQRSLAELKNDPPKIVFSDRLAVLLLYDGEPIWGDVDTSAYERALNTAYVVVRDKRSKRCYLTNGSSWYAAAQPLGPWQSISDPPADLVAMLPKDDSGSPKPATPPAVVVATEPTELVVSDGTPDWKPVGDGELLYVENTETPWLRELASQQIYLLLSGRWFRAASTDGPWSFVRADQLPESFKKIPAGSDIGGVRVAIAGTDEAEDALLDAAIPQTAAIDRNKAKLEVQYDGAPKFEKIPGTAVSHAVNTPAQVLEIGGKYYAVDDGVWFVAAKAEGPWAVADSVPEAEIQKIPPSSPVYNTTYVHIYESTPQVVYVGYTPGYLWSYPYYGVPVYGTGWYYRPYPGYYYPRPVTYGLHVGYNPWTGWNFGFSWNVGFLHFGVAWGGGYHGAWGGYWGHGCAGWYGGYRPGWGGVYRGGHNEINIGSINIGNNVNFGNRTTVSNRISKSTRANDFRQPSVYNRAESRSRNADRATTTRDLQRAQSTRGIPNDVVADRNGELARQTSRGLQTFDSGKWQDVDRGAMQPRAREIDTRSVQRDFSARQRGLQRESMQRAVPRGRPMGGGGFGRRR
ncbi:MAG: carbohydrate-binding family V/XII [Acidobacteria bacterium]|nr:carbohydrate-binding family V/XII [Acidobacteriota bacterium]